ncbi:PaaI family thioesterase [Dietzia sp.]|uniref:PaaI family thioesterase n=1 Tax=Dietzia sp. TaxID=1871616 RepID=UPI003FA5537D
MTEDGNTTDMFAAAEGRETLGTTLGFEYVEVSPDRVVLTVAVTEKLQQPHGIIHGGVYASIGEEVASVGGQVWLGEKGHVVGTNNNTDFLRSASTGTLTATGTPVHRGRSQQLWRTDIVDQDGRLIATSQVRLANLTTP